MKTVHLITAARPNFMKIAPLYHALKRESWCKPVIVQVRQHTDDHMSVSFLREFGITEYIGIDMGQYADYAKHDRPDATVIPGDVNASADCAVTAARMNIPVVHLEAGLRSFDRSMPEEINRIVIDHVSDLHWAPTKSDGLNLWNEGIPIHKVDVVGNIMIDAFEMLRPKIKPWVKGTYAVATLHRPSNVDDPWRLQTLIAQLNQVGDTMDVIFPMHPRTRRRLAEFDIDCMNLHICNPMSYTEFMALVMGATIVITDSGGVQEETSYLGIPCATVRGNTERPVTVTLGTNVLIPPKEIGLAAIAARKGEWPKGKPIPLWDGKTAERCVASLRRFLGVSDDVKPEQNACDPNQAEPLPWGTYKAILGVNDQL